MSGFRPAGNRFPHRFSDGNMDKPIGLAHRAAEAPHRSRPAGCRECASAAGGAGDELGIGANDSMTNGSRALGDWLGPDPCVPPAVQLTLFSDFRHQSCVNWSLRVSEVPIHSPRASVWNERTVFRASLRSTLPDSGPHRYGLASDLSLPPPPLREPARNPFRLCSSGLYERS